ncbi:metallophosphoesterase [Acidocella sp.]|uniref:metallophosphoesterase n=1 Tax=Acidocella sp. TaxID=50710 RepID=UPI00262B49E3|nr:metallophosphoesterase [Acidocella sp.]
MIRILHMSDLHIEMERWRLSIAGWKEFVARHKSMPRHPWRGPMLAGLPKPDLVVLAGDIHQGLRSVAYAEEVAAYLGAPVVLVAGNHEYYHQHMDLIDPALHAAALHTQGRVRFLENSVASFAFDGGRLHVLGCTLWTDYRLRGEPFEAMEFAARRMNDHRLIYRASSRFMPRHAQARHEASRKWLQDQVVRLRLEDPQAKVLVVTHHAPSPEGLGARHGEIAPAYASSVLEVFGPTKPHAWIHGHTHYRHDSEVNGVRLVSAPRGYVTYERDFARGYRPGILEL